MAKPDETGRPENPGQGGRDTAAAKKAENAAAKAEREAARPVEEPETESPA